ncbi:aldo/keto reductase [Nocardioides anomalus]|uniref:Aldo/keto reductase n=1 Tax=Nocardioides anomalus TaxID=2712223 RepID=A0A6G6WIJ3_9ACTN|nr:aldo/keto reductase [Nocardioides anomalus]QIG44963.1 aldo/keto reductase [Nocardioides anomalus]
MDVRRIGLGAKRLLREGYAPADRDAAVRLVRRAVELGVDHIDTAAFYPSVADASQGPGGFTSLGVANAIIREALEGYAGRVVVATKVGPTDAGLAAPGDLRSLVEADLRALGRERLDLVYLRQAGLADVREHFSVLAALREEGLVEHLGLSNVRPEHLDQALSVAPVTALSNRYAPDFGRLNDSLLCRCGDLGIAFVPFFTLAAEGREVGGVADNAVVTRIAEAHGATPAQVRLAWLLSRGPHVLAIPGTSSEAHLVENLAAASLKLSVEDLEALG